MFYYAKEVDHVIKRSSYCYRTIVCFIIDFHSITDLEIRQCMSICRQTSRPVHKMKLVRVKESV